MCGREISLGKLVAARCGPGENRDPPSGGSLPAGRPPGGPERKTSAWR